MIYLNQRDYPHYTYVTRMDVEDPAERESGRYTSVRTSGCGLCSAVMVADRLLPNSTFELKDALRIAYDVNANHLRGTDYVRFAPEFAARLGLAYETTSDPQELIRCLQTGGAAVANVGGNREGHVGLFSRGGHYVAVIGVERDGRIAVLDPSYVPHKYEEEGRAGKVEMKNDVIALCRVEDLVADAANRSPSFHMFWRG